MYWTAIRATYLKILRSQRKALEEKRHRLDHAIRAIHDAERVVRPGEQTDAAVLKKIIEVIDMQDNTDFMNKYYSQDAQAKLAEKRAQWTPELQEKASKDWSDLFRDVEAALDEDPAGVTYEGSLINDRPFGRGVLQFDNRSTIDGVFRGLEHQVGTARLLLDNDYVYEGAVADYRAHGIGTLSTPTASHSLTGVLDRGELKKIIRGRRRHFKDAGAIALLPKWS